MADNKITYKDSGVDKEAGYRSVELMKKHVKSTFTKNVLTDIGGFGGMFSIDKDQYNEPVLVSGTDGVGTKLMIAFMCDKHDTIGKDAVAMCVNDILCQGAKPLFFLDYIATGKVAPEKIATIVEGIANGCKQSGAALIGGETAEMPGLYSDGEYDIAGFAVGIADKSKLITGKNIKEGDILIGLPSSGVHSNGYSLVRKVFFDVNHYNISSHFEELDGTLGEELLKPTRIYFNPLYDLVSEFNIKGISHITGGGFYENIPRMLPDGLTAEVSVQEIKTPEIFNLIQNLGNIETKEMYATFNMGVGIVFAIDANDLEKVADFLNAKGEAFYNLGKVVKGKEMSIKGL